MSYPRRRINVLAVAYLALVHGLALSAVALPARPALVIVALFVYVLEGLGTTVALHRLLSHRAFCCPRWVEYLLVSFAMMTAQGSPILWVATHRRHHKYSDADGDTHSPVRGFLHSHLLWMVDDATTIPGDEERFCKDLVDDPYYRWLLRYRLVPQAVAVVALGAALGWQALPLAFFVPTVLWMHATYCVNSVCHSPTLGQAPFATGDRSRNVAWVAALTFGEGWHNNHHACPRAARHGLDRVQPDLAYGLILLLERVGLAWDIRPTTLGHGASAERDLQPDGARLKQGLDGSSRGGERAERPQRRARAGCRS